MPQAFAYCEEAKKNISLDEAHDLYFAQEEKKRKRLKFRCGDPKCRSMQQPLVVAALYDREDVLGKKLRSPYYREHASHPHINNCTWVNSVNNSGMSDKDKVEDTRSSGSVLAELGLVLKIKRPKSSGSNNSTSNGPDIANSEDLSENDSADDENEKVRPARPQTTKFMANVATAYLKATVTQRNDYPLSIEGICKGTFYSVCLPMFTFHPHFQKERIYQGKTKVVELDNVFLIQFLRKMSPTGDKENRTTPAEIKVLKRWLEQNDRALAAVLHEIAKSKAAAWCFFYTATPPELVKNKVQFTVDDPNLIAILDEQEITVLEPPTE